MAETLKYMHFLLQLASQIFKYLYINDR